MTGTHQGVTDCLSCHAPAVANTFVNVTIVTTPGNHIPIGNLDCNGSGCHTTAKVTAGGFKIGTASINAPTLSLAGHTTVAGQVGTCTTCHETASFMGMIASTSTTAGDSRPNATLDKLHPTTGDCGDCHTTTPIFASNVSTGTKPANHIPTTATCAQCHTTAGNFALYSVTGVHQGVTTCLNCHGSTVANTFANVTMVTTPDNHMPIGTLDCNGSGCHTTAKVTAGGFKIGSASITAPTLNVAGHATVAGQVGACTTCHETAPYVGMIASTNTVTGDSRPNATLDKSHPTTGDCSGCHTHDADIRRQPDRWIGQAVEPHPDHCALRAVPHDRGQLRGVLRHRHAPGRDDLPELPRLDRGEHFRQRHDRDDPEQPHADRQPRLQRLGLPHHRQGDRGRIQDRQREHHGTDAERRPGTPRWPVRWVPARPATRPRPTWA